MSAIVCEVRGVRTQLPPRTAEFKLGATPAWQIQGGLGPVPLSDRALDLLDLAGAIYRLESQIRRRSTDPAIEWKVRAPVRDPKFWRGQGEAPLASVLGFLNRARWHFEFEPRDAAPVLAAGDADAAGIDEILLFSGGMDSLCGAGSHEGRRDRCRLVSFYHSQAGLQQDLAAQLGYGRPVQ
ncbi:MAG TPA: hypothetical protein VEA60_05460, partial [Allosphingosinicella sp.]|nr:hypothetical protein [Allosphingosinicella sp.]